jgi:hypothetical protein
VLERSVPEPFLQIPVILHDPRFYGWDFICVTPGRVVPFSSNSIKSAII